MSSRNFDKEIIKYLIFHELLHQNGYWDHDEDFRKREWQYPNSATLDSRMSSLLFDYKMDSIMENSVWNEIPDFQINSLNHIQPGESDKQATDDPDTVDEPEGIVSGFKYCRNCGNKLPESAKFCDRCGEDTRY